MTYFHTSTREEEEQLIHSLFDNRDNTFQEQQQHHDDDDHRMLAGGASMQPDYSVLSVLVMTLGLIMMVEVVRHRLDYIAQHRPFFRTVLKGVYTELSTLGIVEVIIWLLHSYYDNLDIAREFVFAKVHFTLFYTALLNAVQSVLLAVVAMRVARKQWVHTELLELNHYVELREEFDRVTELMSIMQDKHGWLVSNQKKETAFTARSTSSEGDIANVEQQQEPQQTSNNTGVSIKRHCGAVAVYLSCQFWQLRSKYRELLVQVRFHELRVQFLQAYQLPLKLKISDYLMRSQLHVLKKMVHVSIIAWLLLTGGANLLYVVMGIVLYETEDHYVVGTVLSYIFICSMILFVLLAIVMDHKMNRVFHSIMRERTLWQIVAPLSNTTDPEELNRHAANSDKQLELFWFSDPTVMIAAMQFMQFGYALALSIVIIFWSVINEGAIPGYWYVVVIAISYVFFLHVVAKSIPRYTLCTSLGQLVDSKRLHETVSHFYLDEAKIEQAKQQELRNSERIVYVKPPETNGKTAEGPLSALGMDMVGEAARNVATVVNAATTVAAGAFSAVASGALMNKRSKIPSLADDSSRGELRDAELMAELVQLDTHNLRSNLPEHEQIELANREARRTNRRKANSGGVSAMVRMKSVSDGVSAMARMSLTSTNSLRGDSNNRTMDDSTLHNGKPKAYFSGGSVELRPDDTSPEQLRARRSERPLRRGRQKSVSDGVAFMARLNDAEEHVSIPLTVKEVQDEDQSRSFGVEPNPFGEQKPSLRVMRFYESGDIAKVASADSLASDPMFVAAWTGTGIQTAHNQLRQSQSQTSLEQLSHPLSQCGSRMGHDTVRDDADNYSTKSEGGRSDIDDIPLVNPKFRLIVQAPEEKLECWERLRRYYLGKRFVVLSNVFGTMVAFFFVGERISSFIFLEGITNATEFISFYFPNSINFWVVYSLLCMFILTNVLILYTLGSFGRQMTNRERVVFIAALSDLILTTVCLTVFTVAETQRCCDADDGADDYGSQLDAEIGSPVDYSSHRDLAEEETYADSTTACTCPAFGSREYGGLGTIEPYTTLVGLRIFRFWLAKRLVLVLESSFKPGEESDLRKHEGLSSDPLAITDDSPMTEESGTIVDLWQKAVEKYPLIVAAHGEFSGELLQAMLGISVTFAPSRRGGETGARVGDHPPVESISYEIKKEYQGLSRHAQEIIISGALGKTMKASPSFINQTGLGAAPVIHEGVEANLGQKNESIIFEVDGTLRLPLENEDRFLCPGACLVRSMRRCDKKLLPMFRKNWTTVDVVITRFEIVYFDASGVDDIALNPGTEDIRQALVATKGGKGIRLCDVAEGRRVIGQLPLSDVLKVNVEREMPHLYTPEALDGPEQEVAQNEFWSAKETTHDGSGSEPRNSTWCSIKQDILKIHTKDGGTLCLRFYSDLADAKAHTARWIAEDEVAGPLYKDNAFQWAQCIGRYCGPEQLKQSLPHFGEDTDSELRDYLVVRYDDTRSNRHLMRRTSRPDLMRMPSFGRRSSIDMANRRRTSVLDTSMPAVLERTIHSTGEMEPNAAPPARSKFRRSSSVDESVQNMSRMSLRRIMSFGSSNISKNATSSAIDVGRSADEIAEDDAFFNETPES